MAVRIRNKSNLRLLFSVFNAGDNGVPFDTQWIEGGKDADLQTGEFKKISVGMQAQEGGRWIGSDPKDAKFDPGDTINAVCRLELA
jgi:hypothetical protein